MQVYRRQCGSIKGVIINLFQRRRDVHRSQIRTSRECIRTHCGQTFRQNNLRQAFAPVKGTLADNSYSRRNSNLSQRTHLIAQICRNTLYFRTKSERRDLFQNVVTIIIERRRIIGTEMVAIGGIPYDSRQIRTGTESCIVHIRHAFRNNNRLHFCGMFLPCVVIRRGYTQIPRTGYHERAGFTVQRP